MTPYESALPSETSQAYKKLAQAAELITLADPDNRYLSDAAEFTRLCNDDAEFGEATSERRGMQLRVLEALGTHAVTVGNEPLANHTFAALPLSAQWQLYATAREKSALSVDTLATWQFSLESEQVQAATMDDPSTAASMHSAYTKMLATDYQFAAKEAERKALLSQISKRKAQFMEAINAPGVDPYYRRDMINNLNYSVGRAGIWQEIEDDPFSSEKSGLEKMVVKGLAGQLTWRDRKRIPRSRMSGVSHVLHWLAALQKSSDILPPDLGYSRIEDFAGKALIEEVAPDAANQLELQPSSLTRQLQLILHAKDFETATTHYEHLISHSYGSEARVHAALILSRHLTDMTAVEPAHTVYGNGVQQSIEAIAAQIGTQLDPEIIDARLRELRIEISTLKDPIERMRCLSALTAARVQLDPERSTDTVQQTLSKIWSGLEQTASDAQLSTLRDDIAAHGIRLAPALKQHDSGQYYVGYTPVVVTSMEHPSKVNRVCDLPVDPASVVQWRKTAAVLNALLGEQRYVINTNAQPPQMTGTWRSTLIFLKEFSQANELLAAGRSLNVNEALSARLRNALR